MQIMYIEDCLYNQGTTYDRYIFLTDICIKFSNAGFSNPCNIYLRRSLHFIKTTYRVKRKIKKSKFRIYSQS